MSKSLLVRCGFPVLAGVIVLAGCGARGSTGSSSSASSPSSSASTLTIGFDAPLTGDESAVGLALEYSARVAVQDANRENVVPGVKFTLDPLDDQATPSIGQQNAAKFVADSNVIGVVGPYNSSVAEALESTFDTADLVDVSPANTNPALTQGADFTKAPVRQYKSYFRTIPTDSVESAAVAD